MANNTSTCVLTEWDHTVAENLYFTTYYVVTPSYFVLGIFGHMLCVSTFVKQLKYDPAYLYQIFLSFGEILEIVTYTLFVMTYYWWSGSESTGARWFMADFGCMWFAAHLAMPMTNMFITTSMFLSLGTTTDRLYALVRPFTYKQANHKRHRIAVFSLSFIIGISTSIFDCFRFQITWDGHVYHMSVDKAYVVTWTAAILAQLRNAVRVLGLAALVASNTMLAYSYRKHNRQVGAMYSNKGGGSRTGTVDAKEAQRRLREKTLVILSICDSVLTTMGMTMLISYYVAIYVSPSFFACEGRIMGPILDATLQITEVSNFYIVFAVSKQFREAVGSAMPKFFQRAFGLGQFKTTQVRGMSRNTSQKQGAGTASQNAVVVM